MKQTLRRTLKLVCILGGTLLGLYAGLSGPDLVHRGLLGRWRSFPLPERQRAARFVATEGPYVLVESVAGRLFALALSFDDSASWSEIHQTEVTEGTEGMRAPSGFGECRTEKPYRPGLLVRPVLARAVERLYCWYSPHAEYSGDLQFIIDGRGGVRRWLRTDLGFGIIAWYPICAVVCLPLGVLLGWAAYRLLARLLRLRPAAPEVEKRDRWDL